MSLSLESDSIASCSCLLSRPFTMFSMFLSSLDTDEARELSELFPASELDGELRHLSSDDDAVGAAGPYRVLESRTDSGYVGVGATICCDSSGFGHPDDVDDDDGTGYGANLLCCWFCFSKRTAAADTSGEMVP